MNEPEYPTKIDGLVLHLGLSPEDFALLLTVQGLLGQPLPKSQEEIVDCLDRLVKGAIQENIRRTLNCNSPWRKKTASDAAGKFIADLEAGLIPKSIPNFFEGYRRGNG